MNKKEIVDKLFQDDGIKIDINDPIISSYFIHKESQKEIISDFQSEIENIVNRFSTQLDEKTDTSKLEAALKSVPEQFDQDFSRKINRVLDVVSEIYSHSKNMRLDIDTHSKQLKNALVTETPDAIVRNVISNLSEKIDGYHSASSLTLFIYGMGSAIFGGAMVGMLFLLYFKFYL